VSDEGPGAIIKNKDGTERLTDLPVKGSGSDKNPVVYYVVETEDGAHITDHEGGVLVNLSTNGADQVGDRLKAIYNKKKGEGEH
jgi:hypothetical protein